MVVDPVVVVKGNLALATKRRGVHVRTPKNELVVLGGFMDAISLVRSLGRKHEGQVTITSPNGEVVVIYKLGAGLYDRPQAHGGP